ncbi:hypothetical protein LCX93_11490 [Sulfurimonas sp. SWIR-19]|uniref:hypothetical protein n=1 Tax=Sulfurimonas sp. SWIR-19 TaxID=2878390 RepID=UPI001CF47A35|nr:hypothetical protein [Sulfurimonas sp. SWIR-19]UCN00134.1 hypothetical protein LCX93_11490 [Sulfurimonas sp. SWIR-19]
MKTTNYRLQTEIENLTPQSQKAWFENYIKEVLESDKPYYAKADYIGLSFQELQNKIDYVTADIKELQQLKKRLTDAKLIAQEVTASVLQEYGIDRLDGTAISSLTITPQKTSTKDTLIIKDADALLQLGYAKVTVTVDEKAVAEAMKTLETMNEIDRFVEIQTVTQSTPAKLKINPRKGRVNNQASELLRLVESQAA